MGIVFGELLVCLRAKHGGARDTKWVGSFVLWSVRVWIVDLG